MSSHSARVGFSTDCGQNRHEWLQGATPRLIEKSAGRGPFHKTALAYATLASSVFAPLSDAWGGGPSHDRTRLVPSATASITAFAFMTFPRPTPARPRPSSRTR